jgi:hypothetical protein
MARGVNRGPRNRQTTKPEEVKLPVEDFVTKEETEKEPVEEVAEPKFTKVKVVGCNKLRIRKGPSVNSEIMDIVNENTVLTIADYNPKAEWAVVSKIGDVEVSDAYVMSRYIEVI